MLNTERSHNIAIPDPDSLLPFLELVVIVVYLFSDWLDKSREVYFPCSVPRLTWPLRGHEYLLSEHLAGLYLLASHPAVSLH